MKEHSKIYAYCLYTHFFSFLYSIKMSLGDIQTTKTELNFFAKNRGIKEPQNICS